MNWSSRPITAAERATLAAKLSTSPSRRGLIPGIAYYGSFLVVIPMVGGGMLGTLLMETGVNRDFAYFAGFLIALPLSLLLLVRDLRKEHGILAEQTRIREAIKRMNAIPTLSVSVTRIWSVESEPDWPAYLLQDADRSYVLLSTPELAYADPGFAREGLTITAAPPANAQVLGLTWSGPPLSLEPVELPALEEWIGDGELAIIDAGKLPARWKTAADAG